jgi:hypothetical protein
MGDRFRRPRLMGFRRRSRRKRLGLLVLASVLLGFGVVFVSNWLPDRWAGYSAGVGDAESPAVGMGVLVLAGCGGAVLGALALLWPFIRRVAAASSTRHGSPRFGRSASWRSLRATAARRGRSRSGPSSQDGHEVRRGRTGGSTDRGGPHCIMNPTTG